MWYPVGRSGLRALRAKFLRSVWCSPLRATLASALAAPHPHGPHYGLCCRLRLRWRGVSRAVGRPLPRSWLRRGLRTAAQLQRPAPAPAALRYPRNSFFRPLSSVAHAASRGPHIDESHARDLGASRMWEQYYCSWDHVCCVGSTF